MAAYPPVEVKSVEDMKVADIKREIIALGGADKMSTIIEKTELIALLQRLRAGTPLKIKKIPVILLGERHNDLGCLMKNAEIVNKLYADQTAKQTDFLLVSEGSGINPCYKSFGLHSSRHIIEHSESHSNSELADKLLLIVDLLIGVLTGQIKGGERGAAAGDGIPDTITINVRFFMDRAQHDGFWPLLKKIPNGIETYTKMVDIAFSTIKNKAEFYGLYDKILNYMITSDYLNQDAYSKDLNRLLQKFVATRDSTFIKQIGTLFRLSRDADIIRRVEARARLENSTLKVIVIIIGAMHYDNISSLISKSDVLTVDSKSTNIKFGGRKTKKYRKSIRRRKIRFNKRSYRK